MALRLHFEVDDLLATRFADTVAPLIELGLAAAAIQRRDRLFAPWRAHTVARLPREARPILTLVPPGGAGPTFMDPVVPVVAEGLEAVARSPTPLVRTELRRVFADRPTSGWVRDLDRRDRAAWVGLLDALQAAHSSLIEPVEARLNTGHQAEVMLRGRLTATRGLRAMLASLVPGSHWLGSVLSLPSARDRDERLGGRGLTLLPSAFWTGVPLTCDHPDGSLVLVYPSSAPLPVVDPQAVDADSLAALLGDTRAAVLTTARRARSTSELARDLGVSRASVSEHAKILRNAGLLTSTRTGRSVLHVATALGTQLADGVAAG